MKLDGLQVIAADRMTVWRALNDADVLKDCIPGCQEMTQVSPTRFEAVVGQKFGSVKATFKGELLLENIVEGESLTLRGEGKGGVAGMAKGAANVRLRDVEGGTELSFEGEGSVEGKIAQLGSRLIDGVAQKVANGFFGRFKERVERGTSMPPPLPGDSDEPKADDIDIASVITADDVWEAAGDIAARRGAGTAAEGTAAVAATAAGETASEASQTTTDNLGDRTADIIAGARDTLAGGIEGAKDAASGLAAGAESIGAKAADAAANARESVSDAVSEVGDSASEAVARAKDTLAAGIGEAAETARDAADRGKDAAAATAGGVAATVTGLASRAGEKLDDLHESAREAVIDAGKDVDETAEWNKAKGHLGTAADEAGDAIGDAWDAAKAKAQGAADVAAREWDEAKTNASEAASAAGAAATSAWTAAKGHAAEEAQDPAIGPKGKPWYLWVILALAVLLILWII